MHKAKIKLISKISDIEENYRAFILDIWGVIWDGLEAYDGAISSLEKLKKKNKPVILLSNAPRRARTVQKRLEDIGIKRDLYTKIISSGEICRKRFLKDKDILSKTGKNFYFIGQETDKDISENLAILEKNKISSSNFILVCGTRDFEDELEDYKIELEAGIEYDLPMVCANPDRIVVRKNGKKIICAGELAHYYSLKGGNVIYYGKPYLAVYEECIKAFAVIDSNINKKNILVIGDSLETDIKGANNYGITSVLVTGGIHSDLINTKSGSFSLEKAFSVCKYYKQYPQFIINKFIF